MTDPVADKLRHEHRACVACLHKYAHGLHDGFALAFRTLLKAHPDVPPMVKELEKEHPKVPRGIRFEVLRAVFKDLEVLGDADSRVVNREVRKIGRMIGISS